MNNFISGGVEQVRTIQPNLTFSHGSSVKVWGAYYTNVHIIFKF